MVELQRTYRFCASHRYWREEWTAAQNEAAFGRCALPHGHGHNYRLVVVVAGIPDETTGMLVRLDELDALVESTIITPFDHHNLNVEVAHFARTIPTTENIAQYVFDALRTRLPRGRLAAITVIEDEFLSATVRAPGA